MNNLLRFICRLTKFAKHGAMIVCLCLSHMSKAQDSAVIYSDWSSSLKVGHNDTLQSPYLDAELLSAPWQSSGVLMAFGLQVIPNVNLLDATPNVTEDEAHTFVTAKLGVGYQWYMDAFQFVPKINLVTALSDLPSSNSADFSPFPETGDLIAELDLSAYYEINDRWRVVLSVAKSFETNGVSSWDSLSLGVNYRLGKVTTRRATSPLNGQFSTANTNHNELGNMPLADKPQMRQSIMGQQQRIALNNVAQNNAAQNNTAQNKLQEHAVTSAAPVVLNATEEFVEAPKINKTRVSWGTAYTVQIGSFAHRKSIKPFVKLHKFAMSSLYTGYRGRYLRLYYGHYANVKAATIVAEQFKTMGIDCIVMDIDFSKVSALNF